MAKKLMLLLSILLLWSVVLYAASDLDSVSFATYYPSPYGSYNEMRVNKLSVGANYHDYSGTTIADNSLIVEGNVGIGTASPNTTLQIRKDYNGSTGINIDNAGGSGLGKPEAVIKFGNGVNPMLSIGMDGTAPVNQEPYLWTWDNRDLRIGSGYSGYSLEHMRIKAVSGNVGIGTTNPQAKLEVNGEGVFNGPIVFNNQKFCGIGFTSGSGSNSWFTMIVVPQSWPWTSCQALMNSYAGGAETMWFELGCLFSNGFFSRGYNMAPSPNCGW